MIYNKWEPVNNLPRTLYLEGLHDDHEGFRLLLRGDDPIGRVLRISFDPALSYRNTDEGDLLKSVPQISEMQWPLLTVENSSYLEWYHEESLGIQKAKPRKVLHYLIVTPADCVEVLAANPPIVDWL